MQPSNVEQLQGLLLAEKARSSSVSELYLYNLKTWSRSLIDTHGFEDTTLSAAELEEIFLAESAFSLGALIYMQEYVHDLPIKCFDGGSVSKVKSNPNLFGVFRAVHDRYGWALAAASRSSWLDRLMHEIIVPLERDADPFKDAFEYSIPHGVRHKGGAFLTPLWLADHLLSRLLDGQSWLDTRFLEPCAGTGGFLAAVVARLHQSIKKGVIVAPQAIEFLLRNFVSIERNPASCLALTVNFLMGVARLKGERVSFKTSYGRVLFADCIDEKFYGCKIASGVVFEDLPAVGGFDYIIGNPPWISWETLDRSYRHRIAPVWRRLGLFSGTGSSKSFSKEDICTFVTYACLDRFLKTGGLLSFILPQGIFQSTLNSKGFRRFALAGRECDVPLRVERVDDFTRIQAFSGASTRPAILTLRKGQATEFPVEYNVYSNDGKIGRPILKINHLIAEPVDQGDASSPWSVHSAGSGADVLKMVSGKCHYRARAGVFTGGANAAYYLEGCQLIDGLVVATTVVERAKRKLAAQRVVIEPEFVYPFIRGRDVSFWHAEVDPSRCILLPHTAETKISPVPPEIMEACAPLTLGYFKKVREFLGGRNGLTAMDKANAERGFYAVLRVGGYTFSPFKLVWKYIAKDFTCAVVGSSHVGGHGRSVIPQEKLMMIDFYNEDEAYFVAGVLSSPLFSSAIKSRMVTTQISAKIIETLDVPRFNPDSAIHREISSLCKEGHGLWKYDHEVSRLRQMLDVLVRTMLENR